MQNHRIQSVSSLKDQCRDIIQACIEHKESINKLMLPCTLKHYISVNFPPPKGVIENLIESLMKDKDVIEDLCEYLDFQHASWDKDAEDKFTNLCENLSITGYWYLPSDRPGLVKMSIAEHLDELKRGYPKEMKKSEVVKNSRKLRMTEEGEKENREIDKVLTLMKERPVPDNLNELVKKQVYLKVRRFLLIRFYLTTYSSGISFEDLKFCISNPLQDLQSSLTQFAEIFNYLSDFPTEKTRLELMKYRD